MLTEKQKEMVREARESFLKATRTPGDPTDEVSRYKRYYHKNTLAALVQSIWEKILESDEEDARRIEAEGTADPDNEKTKSGNA